VNVTVLRLVINGGPCADFVGRCLASVRAQRYPHWRAEVTLDPVGDGSFDAAVAAADGDPRIAITRNIRRLYSMVNLIEGVRRTRAAPDEVIVVLDADDWLYDDTALDTIAETYARHDCWMTYGSWISNDPAHDGMQRGSWPAYPDDTVDFRGAEWRHTAIRTWKRWLWDLVDDRDFRDAHGGYFRVTEDQASMLPMLEMSGVARARHIPDVLMVYNRLTPHACGRTHLDEMRENAALLRARPPYARLTARPAPAVSVPSASRYTSR
jgi:glycosyltransferase involved in cell wall biosynthesis